MTQQLNQFTSGVIALTNVYGPTDINMDANTVNTAYTGWAS